MRLLFASNDVRRHRVISISYISLLPCHAGGRGFESRRSRHSHRSSKHMEPQPEVAALILPSLGSLSLFYIESLHRSAVRG